MDLNSQTSMPLEPETPNMSFTKLQNTLSHKFSEFGGLSEPSSPKLLKNESMPTNNAGESKKPFKLDRILPMHAGGQDINDSTSLIREGQDIDESDN